MSALVETDSNICFCFIKNYFVKFGFLLRKQIVLRYLLVSGYCLTENGVVIEYDVWENLDILTLDVDGTFSTFFPFIISDLNFTGKIFFFPFYSFLEIARTVLRIAISDFILFFRLFFATGWSVCHNL